MSKSAQRKALRELRESLNHLAETRFEHCVFQTLTAMVERDPDATAWVVRLTSEAPQ